MVYNFLLISLSGNEYLYNAELRECEKCLGNVPDSSAFFEEFELSLLFLKGLIEFLSKS
jgi:hypothetical protein